MLSDEEYAEITLSRKDNKLKRKQTRRSFYARHIPLVRRSREWRYSFKEFRQEYKKLSDISIDDRRRLSFRDKQTLNSYRWSFWGTALFLSIIPVGLSIYWCGFHLHHAALLWFWSIIPLGLVLGILFTCLRDGFRLMFKKAGKKSDD